MPDASGIRVRDIMVAAPVTVSPRSTVHEAVVRMSENNIGSVVVVESERPVGIFTERDHLRFAATEDVEWLHEPVSEYMTAEPFSVSPGERWDDAMDLMAEHGIRHLPVVEDGRLVGVLGVRDIASHRTGVLESLVKERTRELDRQNELLRERDRERSHHLEMAGVIQRRLTSPAPEAFGPLRFACHFAPHDEVSGDYVDFQSLSQDRLGLIVADVSGHGVPAAFVSVMAKTCYAAYCQGLVSPSEVLDAMNEHLTGLLQDEFITLFVGRFDSESRRLTYARAGHPQPLLFRPGEGALRRLDAEGMMVGVLEEARFAEESVALQAGDRVLFYTDGITEARDANGELFGEDALERAFADAATSPCDEVLRRLLRAVHQHGGTRPFDDDVTLLVMEVT